MPTISETPIHRKLLGEKRGRGGTSDKRFYSQVPLLTKQQRSEAERAQLAASQQKLFKKAHSNAANAMKPIPIGYVRPAYNSPQYWRDCTSGWISEAQQLQDHADFETRRKRAVDSKHHQAASPHRHLRTGPRETKQFSKPMSTKAARDDRLTPQAKALLQVLVARTGRGRSTDTTKTTLGIIMNRCPRSIQRYVQDLVKFGYIRTQIRKSRRTGFYIGLRIWIMNSVLPFFAQKNTSYDPEKWLNLFESRRNQEETKESLTNNKNTIINTFREKKPPWFAEYTFS